MFVCINVGKPFRKCIDMYNYEYVKSRLNGWDLNKTVKVSVCVTIFILNIMLQNHLIYADVLKDEVFDKWEINKGVREMQKLQQELANSPGWGNHSIKVNPNGMGDLPKLAAQYRQGMLSDPNSDLLINMGESAKNFLFGAGGDVWILYGLYQLTKLKI